MAKTRKGRNIHGIVLVDKPLQLTSNQVVQKVKWLFNAQKAGHTGALDPLATGMLPVCLGEATKFSQYLLDADKCYEVTACLGVRTTTSDAAGEVVCKSDVKVTENDVVQVVETFKGAQRQVPSMYSALKYEGRPLYYYARKGMEVPREARPIHIYELVITHMSLPFVSFFVRCSKGTYIRSLIDDIGQVLGCGAYVTRLHRPSLGQYQGLSMVSIEQLEQRAPLTRSLEESDYSALDGLLLPIDAAILHLPELLLQAQWADKFCRGGSVPLDRKHPLSASLAYRVYRDVGEKKVFLGVGEDVPAPIDQPASIRDNARFVRPRRVVVYD